MDVIVRVPHPRSGDSQGQETFLAPSADKQTRNYDIECSNHHPSLSKGLYNSKAKGIIDIYRYRYRYEAPLRGRLSSMSFAEEVLQL